MLQNLRRGWYALYVRSRHEKKVNSALIRNSIKSYLPLKNKLKKWSDRKKYVLEPLFPSYVFVFIDQATEFSKALTLDGVCGFVRFGKKYAQVKEEEIKNIKILLAADCEEVESLTELPAVGEKRIIRHGLLAGLECEIIKVKNKSKILVRVDSIDLCLTAILPSSYMERGLPHS